MSHVQNSPLSHPLSPPPHPPHISSSPPITAPLTRSPLSNRSNLDPTRWDYKDSSEGQPSSHESLYDASHVSTSDRAKSPYQTAAAATAVVRPVTPPPRPLRGAIDLDSESPLSRLETPFLYGHGTELAPILEQRSIATLRTGSFSTSDVSSLMHGAPPSSSKSKPFNENGNDEYDEDSDFGCSYNSSNSSPHAPLLMRQRHQQQQHQHQLRRRQSFSLDDLPLVYATSGRSPEKEPVVAVTESPSSSPLRSRPRLSAPVYAHPTTVEVAADVYAYPQRPLYPAHQSPQTPPGLATLMEHQGQHGRRQRQGTSGHDAPPPFPAFRAQRSAHGNLASHPFMRRHGGTSIITSGDNGGRGGAPHTVDFIDAPPLPPTHTHAHAHALVNLNGNGDGDLGVPPRHRALAAQPDPGPGPGPGPGPETGAGAGGGVVPGVRAAEPDADDGGGAGAGAGPGMVRALRVPEGGGAGVVVVVLLRSGVGVGVG
ncbi:hypothetical protein F5X96DRAFT_683699 [Biscogniauxia mediterranea]|nr:hypothetical protein F5X96DRAFT_683699 [Biscogniauxia mediterranea]